MSGKGVSSVVGTVLTIVMVLSLGAAAFVWANAMLSSYVSSLELSYQVYRNRLQEDFVIEFVHFNMSSNTMTAFVRNVGDREVNIVSAYVTAVDGGAVESVNLNVKVYVGQLKPVSIRLSNVKLASGTEYRISLVSALGGRYTVVKEAP
jgi:flagellin-like protein